MQIKTRLRIRTRLKYGNVAKDILMILALSGMVAVAATSPYFWTRLAKEIERKSKFNGKNGQKTKTSVARSLVGLNKNKIIIVKKEGDNYTVKLSDAGKKIVKKIQFESMSIEKQEKWDGKWRIVIFDIPEGNNRRGKIIRDATRFKMKRMGFYQLQKSVWVHAYPCEKEIQLLCEVLKIGPFVNIITAEKIYNDDVLIEHFRLKRS